MVVGVPSQANGSVGKKPETKPEPRAIERPDACSRLTDIPSENSVREGSNGEQATVTGSVTDTRSERVGAPRLIVIACAVPPIAPNAAMTAATENAFDNIVSLRKLGP
jgi:hypothetical protein